MSRSQDKTLRIWNLRTGHTLHVLRGHRTRITCARYDGKRVVSSGGDNLIKVWDPESGRCTHTLHGHSYPIFSLLVRTYNNLTISAGIYEIFSKYH